jgi:hypothetical protein
MVSIIELDYTMDLLKLKYKRVLFKIIKLVYDKTTEGNLVKRKNS